MVLQQFGGVNAIAYYASAIFSSAGELVFLIVSYSNTLENLLTDGLLQVTRVELER